MTKYYILRVGDGDNFANSRNLKMWAIQSRYKTFLKKVKTGDKLWFIQNINTCEHALRDYSVGKIIAVADFVSKNKRDIGPLLALTPTNDELGWNEKGDKYDVEIHYNNLYRVREYDDIYLGINIRAVICEYDNVKDKLCINLVEKYEDMCKFLQPEN